MAKQQHPEGIPDQTLQQHVIQPTISQSALQTQELLEDTLMDDGLRIPELDDFGSKDNFLTGDSKTDSIFPAAFLGGSDLFPGSSLFGGDSLGDDIKLEDEKKPDAASLSSLISTDKKQEQKTPSLHNNNIFNTDMKPSIDENNTFLQAMQSQQTLPGSLQLHGEQTYQNLQPVMQPKPSEQFLPFPFHHPQFAPQQISNMSQHMISISELLNNTTATTTISISSSAMSLSYSNNMLPTGMREPPKQKGGKGRGKTGKGGGGKGSGKGKAGR